MKRKLCAGVALAAIIVGGSAFSDATVAQELVFAPGEDERLNWASFDAFAEAHDFSGERLTVAGPWTGRDARLVESVLAYFAAATGAEVVYSGSDSFEQDIVISTQAGSAPNIAVFPQPGLAADMAAQGFLEPLGDDTADWVRENYSAGESWVDLGSFTGPDGDDASTASSTRSMSSLSSGTARTSSSRRATTFLRPWRSSRP